MKNNKSGDFNQFKTKIFVRTMVMVVIAITVVFLLLKFVLNGHFANWTVDVFQKVFHIKYYEASNLYRQLFRNNIEVLLIIAAVIIFLIIFRIYLNWFETYFREINKGIDTLIDESSDEASLPPELAATEKKINTAKHILEKRKLDAQLAEQRKNDLIVYLAHDLKTPLASVIGYLNLLRDECRISEKLREKYLSISLEKAERLEDLINEFFEIAKFNLSTITLQYSEISLTRLLEMLLYEFGPILKERELDCRLDIENDIMLMCDADKIQRVFDNLLKNAVIYSYKGTQISISAVKIDGKAVVQFANYGDTIPEDKLEQIFEQFYRLDAVRSTENGGAGLGLAIAKQIVELHHGSITAKSENEMTTFEIILPFS